MQGKPMQQQDQFVILYPCTGLNGLAVILLICQTPSEGEFSSDLYRALVCDIIIRKCIFGILQLSGLFLSTPLTLSDIKSVWATSQNTLLL